MSEGSDVTKVVVNECYGGFSLSAEACRRYLTRKGHAFTHGEPDFLGYVRFKVDGVDYWSDRRIDRTDTDLVSVVEELGGADASGPMAWLAIKTIPKGTLYRIREYDGMEGIETAESVDWSTA